MNIFKDEHTEFDIQMEGNSNKVLGTIWNTKDDFLGVSVPETLKLPKLTKRTVLSLVAQCFDPLGLLSPVTIMGKLIIQKLWMMELDWDTLITDNVLLEKWSNYVNTLPLLNSLKVPIF